LLIIFAAFGVSGNKKSGENCLTKKSNGDSY